MSRTSNSIKNIITAILSQIIVIIIGFLAQKVFLTILGEQYNGINGLFSNLVSMFSVAELGLGTAIIYHLYKPIAQNNIEEIKSLIHFYKKSYRLISIIIFVIGLIFIPCLKYIVTDISIPENIYIIYFLFLIDTCISYLLIYKQSILIGFQQNYIINTINLFYTIIYNIISIIVLIYTKSFYCYLILKTVFKFLQNFILKVIADRKYSFINDSAQPLSKDVQSDIFIKVRALLVHKIGSLAVFSSDNIIISTAFGIGAVGFYQNYRMVISQITNLFTQMFSSLTSSVGNLIAQENSEKNYSVYRNISFINYWLTIFCSFSLYVCLNPFISLWIGEKWIMGDEIVIPLVTSFFLTTLRSGTSCFKDAAGIYDEDKHVPFIELIVNIFCSILLSKFIGLSGVFIGTVLSNLVIHLYSYPVFVITKIFNHSYIEYYIDFLKKIILFVFIIVIGFIFKRWCDFGIPLLNLFMSMIISIIFPNMVLYALYNKKQEFIYFRHLIFSKLTKKGK